MKERSQTMKLVFKPQLSPPTIAATMQRLLKTIGVISISAALAGCGTQSAHTRAAAQCWMSTEKSQAKMNLDKRADIVNKCIEDKMK